MSDKSQSEPVPTAAPHSLCQTGLSGIETIEFSQFLVGDLNRKNPETKENAAEADALWRPRTIPPSSIIAYFLPFLLLALVTIGLKNSGRTNRSHRKK